MHFKICKYGLYFIIFIVVEQVYSIPIEERINRTCLAEVQIENLHLEHELKRIFEQQSADKHRIQELSLIEKILNNLQWELNSTYLKNEGIYRSLKNKSEYTT